MIEQYDLIKWLGSQFRVMELTDTGAAWEDMRLQLQNGSEVMVAIERNSSSYEYLAGQQGQTVELNFDENEFPIHIALLFHTPGGSARGWVKRLMEKT